MKLLRNHVRGHGTPWLIACDANIESDAFVQYQWFGERTLDYQSSSQSICRSKGPDGVEVARMYDHVVACKGLFSINSQSASR